MMFPARSMASELAKKRQKTAGETRAFEEPARLTGTRHHDHSEHVNPSTTESRLGPTVEQKTDNGTALLTIVDGCLPIGWDVFRTVCSGLSKSINVGLLTEKVVDKSDVHPFHN